MDSWLLRTPRSVWKPYYDFAVQIEGGLPEISKILASDNLLRRFHVSDMLCDELCEILKNGSSSRIDKMKNQVLALSRAKMHKYS
jgi:hypothetical protein